MAHYDPNIFDNVEATRSSTPLFALSRLSWGGVWAGAICSVALIITLNMLSIWGTQGVPGLGASIWFVISSFCSFFVGGWMAARVAGIPDKGVGRLHGFTAWGLGALGLGIMVLYAGMAVATSPFAATRLAPLVTGSSIGAVAAVAFFDLVISAFLAVAGGHMGAPRNLLTTAGVAETPIIREEPPRKVA